jgi:hypothetical protein
MRRITPLVLALALVFAACGDDTAVTTTTTSTTVATTTTTGGATSTTVATTTTTTEATTTTTTVPGQEPTDATAYCVRGTDPTDALNVRSGPGGGFDIVGTLAWNAVDVPSAGSTAPDDQGRLWYLVEYDGGIGWSAGWYLEPAPCTASVASPAPLTGTGLPSALSGGLVPWSKVTNDWILALYGGEWNGPRVLYLLSPYGDRYEVFSWPAGGVEAFALYDWQPGGEAALVMVGTPTFERQLRLIDLRARTSTTIVTLPELSEWRAASFTRPTGRDIVWDAIDSSEVLKVLRTDGSTFSTLLDRPKPTEYRRYASWLYGLGGTTVVVGDGSGLSLLTNQGALVRALDAPGQFCQPERWWNDSTVVVGCTPNSVLSSQPASYYHRLWLVPIDGSAATALTALPATTPDIVDFGFSDAMRSGGTTFAQWTGDCGAAGVEVVDSSGAATGIAQGRLVGIRGSSLVVQQWEACDGTPGSLVLMNKSGTVIGTLIPAPAVDQPGVIAAVMIRDRA